MEIFIYGLVDCQGIVKYVGSTKNLTRTLKEHLFNYKHFLKYNWIRNEVDNGRKVELITLEVTNPKFRKEREDFWIELYGIGQLFNQIRALVCSKCKLKRNSGRKLCQKCFLEKIKESRKTNGYKKYSNICGVCKRPFQAWRKNQIKCRKCFWEQVNNNKFDSF